MRDESGSGVRDLPSSVNGGVSSLGSLKMVASVGSRPTPKPSLMRRIATPYFRSKASLKHKHM